jgi:anti-anti-sigma regulatory factor
VLDGASISALDTQIDQLACTPCSLVVVDAAGLEGVDHTGSRALVGLGHYVRARGGTYCLLGARGTVATTLAAVSFSDDGWYSDRPAAFPT